MTVRLLLKVQETQLITLECVNSIFFVAVFVGICVWLVVITTDKDFSLLVYPAKKRERLFSSTFTHNGRLMAYVSHYFDILTWCGLLLL